MELRCYCLSRQYREYTACNVLSKNYEALLLSIEKILHVMNVLSKNYEAQFLMTACNEALESV